MSERWATRRLRGRPSAHIAPRAEKLALEREPPDTAHPSCTGAKSHDASIGATAGPRRQTYPCHHPEG
eukprot:13376957-Alexandrium_andersonii.AAC.1